MAYGFKEIREELVGLRYAALLHAAKGRKVEVTLTLDEYRQVTASDCAYCGGDLPFAGYGLDRKDPPRGYTLDNVVPCSRMCNRIKSDLLDPQTMVGIKGRLYERRLRAILQQTPSGQIRLPKKRGRHREQHPTPKLRGCTWEILVRDNVSEPDGSIKRKVVRVNLGRADEMDFAKAKLAAQEYVKAVNSSSFDAGELFVR
jgi:hypothetical protein